MVESKRRRYLKLVLIGGGVLLVGGIGVVVYLLWPPNLDDTTPVGAFNKHIDARYRRDWETAISCLSDRQCRIRAEEVRSKILRGGTPGLTRQDLALPDRQLLVRDEARFDEKGMAKDIERGRIEWDLTKGSVENPPLKEFKILSAVTRGDRCVITYQRPGFVEGYNLRMAMIREGRRWFVEGFVFDDLGAVPEAAAPTATTTPHP